MVCHTCAHHLTALNSAERTIDLERTVRKRRRSRSKRPRRWHPKLWGTLHFKMQHADQRGELDPVSRHLLTVPAPRWAILKIRCPHTSTFYIGTPDRSAVARLMQPARAGNAASDLTPLVASTFAAFCPSGASRGRHCQSSSHRSWRSSRRQSSFPDETAR